MDGYSVKGFLQFWRGDWDEARRNVLEQGEHHLESTCVAAKLALALGEIALAERALRYRNLIGPDRQTRQLMPHILEMYCILVRINLAHGDEPEAEALLAAAEGYRAQGIDRISHPQLLELIGERHLQRGDAEEAAEAARAALQLAASLGDLPRRIAAGRLLGEALVRINRSSEGEEALRTALALAERCQYRYEIALTQLALARSVPGAHDAADLLAAACRCFSELGALPALRAAESVLAARTALTGQVYPGGLTERQVEIIRLVATGLTDKEIAARLYISYRTVDGHLRGIFNKVGVSNRAQLTAFASQQGLVRPPRP